MRFANRQTAYFVSLIHPQIGNDASKIRVKTKHGQKINVNQEDVWGCHLTEGNIS